MKKAYYPLITILIAILVIIGSVVIFIPKDKLLGTSGWSYEDSDIHISLRYPRAFTLSTRPKQEGALIMDLRSADRSMVFVFLPKTLIDAQKDEKFYENVLFSNKEQTINSRVQVGDVHGFRAKTDLAQLRHTLYRPVNASSTLIIRSEINASSSDAIIDSEKVFFDIIGSIKVDE